MWDHRIAPITISHVYWKQKPAFQFREDEYADWVLFAVADGRFRYRIESFSGEAGFGDLIFCPPSTVFEREVLEPVSFYFYTFGLDSGGDEAPRPPVHLTVKDHHRLASTYQYMEQAMQQGLAHDLRQRRLEHYWQDLWVLLSVEAERRRQAAARGGVPDPKMQEAARQLQQYALGPVAIHEVGLQLGLNAVQFTRRFQAAFGQTPMDYVTSLRLQKAQSLLTETDLTLDRIAEAVGYESGFYLSRMFTKKLHLSPSVYRKTHRV
ncbi:AraC family transcriptional regulator [Paenibacillus silviterrae]|uniref:AraC family transcriptional regulator n=1 Tax=Paenibacillus silviterrae TaxID=3242194 RepID=UPI00254283EE|nr:AraC family transcriptional regulator [Paenibacillus chinjuensis]